MDAQTVKSLKMTKEIDRLYSSFFAILLLSLLMWGEGRGEPAIGKTAIGWVVRNRVYATRKYGRDWIGVMLRKKQFSCFNVDDVNREKVEEVVFNPQAYKQFRICYETAHIVYHGIGFDPSNGATHYFHRDLQPKWARKMIKTAEVGNHVFYKYKDE